MLQSWKQIVVLGVLMVTGLGLSAAGLVATPQASSPRSSSVQLAPTGKPKASTPILIEQSFELLKGVGKPRDLAPRVHHVYFVDLRADQLLRAVVQQVGIDVQLDVFGLSGEPLVVINSPNGSEDGEFLLLVARRPGRYKVVVSTESEHRTDKTYVIKVAEVRRATPQDRRQAAAMQGYYAAKDLARKGEKDLAKLLPAFAAAARSLDAASAPMELRAYAWKDLGTLYEGKSLWRESRDAGRNAAALFHRLGMKRREASALIRVGLDEQKLLDIDMALKHFEQARVLAQAAGAEQEEAAAAIHLGMFYADRADAWNATRYIERAVSLRKKNQEDDRESLALVARGLLYMRLGEDEQALKIYGDQLQQLKLSPPSRAIVLTQIGLAYINLGKLDKALQSFQQAYDLQKGGNDLDNQANTLVGFGLVYIRQHNFRDALGYFRKALKIYQDRNDSLQQAVAFMNIGWTLGSLQRYEDATDSFRRALVLVRYLRNPVLEGGVLLGFAWTERLRGNLSGAQLQAEKALKLVELTRSGIPNQVQRISYLAGVQDFYEFLIGTLLDQHDLRRSPDLLERALQVSESARSRGLLDTLGASAASRLSPVLTAREIQQQVLDSGTILLEYSLGEQKSYLFLVTSSDIKRFDLPPREELEARAKDTYEALAKVGTFRDRIQAIQKAKDLSRLLIGPVADQLGDKRLLIVPAGALQLIPFGALPDPTAPAFKTNSGAVWPEPLFLRHDVMHEPSASVLAGIRKVGKSRLPASGMLAALGDAVFELDDDRILRPFMKVGIGSDPVLGHLDRLPASGQEAEAITSGLPSKKILKALGFDANRDLFVSGRLADFRVLHIATHAYYSAQHPELSAMVLSRFDRKGRARQGLLRIEDVMAMDLRSDLVVLSACSSGLGKDVRGEGIVGWPWAFLSAGASEVVMSLWDVPDPSTAEFMAKFYENMASGISSGRALRETQIQMWKDQKSPKTWAGFAALGEWNIRPLLLNKNPSTVSSQDGDPRNPTMMKRNPPLNALR
jgi:CHAT domain-containing protein/tetratricopeptide (TPR) repeat protein